MSVQRDAIEGVVVIFESTRPPAGIGPTPCVGFVQRSTKRGWAATMFAAPAVLLVDLLMGSRRIFKIVRVFQASRFEGRNRSISQPLSEALGLSRRGRGDAGRGAGRRPEPIPCKVGTTPLKKETRLKNWDPVGGIEK